MTGINTATVAVPTTNPRMFAMSRFNHKRDTAAVGALLSWEELCDELSSPRVSIEKDGPLISPARFEPATRSGKHVKGISFLAYDFDHHVTKEGVKQRMDAFGYAYFAHSTHSHKRKTESNPEAEDRLRVIIPLTTDIPPPEFLGIWLEVSSRIGVTVDPSPKALAQMFYVPTTISRGMPFYSHEGPGEFLDWRTIKPQPGPTVVKKPEPVPDIINENRNNTLFSLACSLRKKGLSEAAVRVAVHTENEAKCTPPLGRDEVDGLVDSSGRYKDDQRGPQEKEVYKPLQIIYASDVKTKAIEWLWEPYLPKNYVTLFSGPEGVGKSWVFCAIASGISNGFLPLCPESFEPGKVLFFAAEDAADDALVPRLIKCGADLSKVFIVNERMTFNEKGLLRVQHYIAETNPAWVVIDPLFSYSDTSLDMNKPHHARAVTTSIENIAKRFGISISYLIHFNKSMGQGDARAAVSSSQEFSNAARSILLIGKDPKDEDRRALVHRKHNYSPKGKSIGY
ncbi:MAG: AAA family ATPase, partial [Pyrinomonadaceae bacterium]